MVYQRDVAIRQIVYKWSNMNARKIIVLLLVITCFLSVTANANEFQRILFRAAGNLGVMKGTIELSGWNDAVAATVRAGIAATIDRLRELLDNYPEPPFNADGIRNIISGLERFDQLMARRNVRAREAYFTATHGNLQAAMSVIYRSQTGLII